MRLSWTGRGTAVDQNGRHTGKKCGVRRLDTAGKSVRQPRKGLLDGEELGGADLPVREAQGRCLLVGEGPTWNTVTTMARPYRAAGTWSGTRNRPIDTPLRLSFSASPHARPSVCVSPAPTVPPGEAGGFVDFWPVESQEPTREWFTDSYE